MSQMFLVEPYIEPEYPITQRSGETNPLYRAQYFNRAKIDFLTQVSHIMPMMLK